MNLDQLDGNRKGVVRTIAEQGYIDANIETSFPATEMVNPNMFVSLSFCYGMLTIGGTYLDKLHLVVPNKNVWEQYYRFLLDQYQSVARIDTMKLDDAFDTAATKGDWHPLFEYLSERYFEDSSVRDAIGGKNNVQEYQKADAKEAEAQAQWKEAEAQVKKYMTADSFRRLTQGTETHGLILQFQNGKLLNMQEVVKNKQQ